MKTERVYVVHWPKLLWRTVIALATIGIMVYGVITNDQYTTGIGFGAVIGLNIGAQFNGPVIKRKEQ